MCGKVVAVGPSVKEFIPGDVVFGNGQGCAEYTITSADALAKVPDGGAQLQAEALAVFGGLGVAAGTAYQMLELAGLFEGSEPKNIMVIGASGGVGSCAVQIAKAKCAPGSTVTAVCSGNSAEYVQSIGADSIIDYSKAGLVFASCVPGSFDGIIDCVSSPDDYNYVPEGSKIVKPTSGHYVAAHSAKVLDWIQLFTFGFGRG